MVLWFTGRWSGVEPYAMCLGCGMYSSTPDQRPVNQSAEQHPATRTHNIQLHTRPTTCKPKRRVPQAATIGITLELLMIGIMVPGMC